MITLKPGVDVSNLQPQIVLALISIDQIYAHEGQECVITSACDGHHMAGSKHYEGLAVDLRTRFFSRGQIALVRRKIEKAVGDGYQCIIEKDHLHFEYDPPRRVTAEV